MANEDSGMNVIVAIVAIIAIVAVAYYAFQMIDGTNGDTIKVELPGITDDSSSDGQ